MTVCIIKELIHKNVRIRTRLNLDDFQNITFFSIDYVIPQNSDYVYFFL